MLTRSQWFIVGFATALPFLLMVFLMVLSPGYMTRIFENRVCGNPMLSAMVVFQALVAVLLRATYLRWNTVRKNSDVQQPRWMSQAGLMIAQLFCVLLIFVSVGIVLLGPAVIQLMNANP